MSWASCRDRLGLGYTWADSDIWEEELKSFGWYDASDLLRVDSPRAYKHLSPGLFLGEGVHCYTYESQKYKDLVVKLTTSPLTATTNLYMSKHTGLPHLVDVLEVWKLRNTPFWGVLQERLYDESFFEDFFEIEFMAPEWDDFEEVRKTLEGLYLQGDMDVGDSDIFEEHNIMYDRSGDFTFMDYGFLYCPVGPKLSDVPKL